MIYDRLSNLALYANGASNLDCAIRAIMENPIGTVVKGEGYSSNLIQFTTTPLIGARYEAHRKFIDIHIVLKGKEYVECTHLDNLEKLTEYDVERDILFGDNGGVAQSTFHLSEGYALICHPHDAHLVGKHTYEASDVEKIVVKVAL